MISRDAVYRRKICKT